MEENETEQCHLCDLREHNATMAMRGFYVAAAGLFVMILALTWHLNNDVKPLQGEIRTLTVENEMLKGQWCDR